MNIKRFRASIVLIFIVLFCLPLLTYAQNTYDSYQLFKGNLQEDKCLHYISDIETNNEKNSYERRVIVQLEEGHTFDAKSFGVQLVDKPSQLGNKDILVVKIPHKFNFEKKLNEIKDSPDVIDAEADTISKTSYIPSHEILSNQWYLNYIGMPEAWKINEGSKEITIAVLDTGVNKNHPALKGRVKSGRDIINNKKDTSDDHGHGTHVAGIIAANSEEMTGLDLDASILPVKVMDDEGNGPTSSIIKGIHYAIEQDVDVINMSFVNYTYSDLEEEALWEAYKRGIVLVAASGNEGWSRPAFPASYLPVMSVAANNEDGQRAIFSNYGDWVDLSAPGVNMFSANYLGGYQFGSGTSFSSPIVSALAGMLKSQHPDWQPEEIEWALESSTNQVSHREWNPNLGFGVVDAHYAFKATPKVTVDEAKNQPNKAMELELGQTIQDYLTLPMDVSWYHFQVDDEVNLSIKLSNLPKHLDLVGTLYEENDGYIHRVTEIDQGARGETEKIKIDLSPGKYFFSIHDYFGKWSKAAYNLTITTKEIEGQKSNFSDVSLYEKEINYLTVNNVIRGYSDGTFKPRNNITRLQAVQMILNEMDIDVSQRELKNPGFSDVDESSYGYNYIATAAELGIIRGKDDNTFDSFGHLTRAQMAAIMVKAYDLKGDSKKDFKDVLPNHWAYDVVNTLAANGIAKGYEDNTFRPLTHISRDHFAVFLYNKINNEAIKID